MTIRPLELKQDFAAVRRIWEEIGWIDRNDDDDAKYLRKFLKGSRTLAAELAGAVECTVSSCDGTILHQQAELSMAVIAAVTTSTVARKQGLASQLTARVVAQEAESGMATAALGMFEQGYYSRLGFGTGPYERFVKLNPALINIDVDFRPPLRLTQKHAADLYQALMQRWRGHGGTQLASVKLVEAEMGWTEEPLGLGYRDEEGKLTHFVWGRCKGEYGPFHIHALAYQNRQQLLELMALLRSLGDQIVLVTLFEPQHVQLQDLIRQPFRNQRKTEGGKYEEGIKAEAWWQLRINDLATCIAATHLSNHSTLSLNLTLDDPIRHHLDSSQPWQGISGEYTLHLGQECKVSAGHSKKLPQLNASVGGFSRLWLGAASATRLATSGDVTAADDLIENLDRVFLLPTPATGWQF